MLTQTFAVREGVRALAPVATQRGITAKLLLLATLSDQVCMRCKPAQRNVEHEHYGVGHQKLHRLLLIASLCMYHLKAGCIVHMERAICCSTPRASGCQSARYALSLDIQTVCSTNHVPSMVAPLCLWHLLVNRSRLCMKAGSSGSVQLHCQASEWGIVSGGSDQSPAIMGDWTVCEQPVAGS